MTKLTRSVPAPHVLGLVLALATVGCGPPVEGEPCGYGSEPYVETPPGGVLLCTGPPGCDDPAFRWERWEGGLVGSDPPLVEYYCTCSGQTRRHEFEQAPDVPWQFYGSCEEPCAEVRYLDWSSPEGFGLGAGWPARGPIAAECESCDGAAIFDGRCVGPEGRLKPRDCCRCEGAVRDADGACISGEFEALQISEDCCPP